MTQTIAVEARQLGGTRQLCPARHLPLDPIRGQPDGRLTLRDLIPYIVRQEVDAFRQRQADMRLVRVLTQSEISQGAATGKVDSGGRGVVQEVDADQAVETALEAFGDGLYFVFIDGSQLSRPDAAVTLRENSTVTFVRLVALAGG